jgi:glycosyltransferase involved in cell wall biosynthesis
MKTILLISPYWREPHRWMVSTVKLAELWQRLGYKVVVLCMGKREGQKAKYDVEEVSSTLSIHRVKDLFLRDPWNYGIAFGFSGKALALARTLKPDVIVVNKVLFWSSFALLRLRLHKYRVLLLTDALVGITWWPRNRFARICAAIYAWTGGWLILRAASAVVFFHPQLPAVLRRLGIEKKSRVVPTGIDLEPYFRTPNPNPNPSPTKGLDLGLGLGGVTATYIGRLESVKGADDFVAAALRVKRDRPELKIQVVGWHTENHPLVKAHREEVAFLGLRDDIAAILAGTNIFVLPSYSEGLSNALMEAMASGCACIASDVGGNTFLIRNGISGFLFPAGDREALAAHIRRLIDDPAKRASLGEAARKRIEEAFSWGRNIENFSSNGGMQRG